MELDEHSLGGTQGGECKRIALGLALDRRRPWMSEKRPSLEGKEARLMKRSERFVFNFLQLVIKTTQFETRNARLELNARVEGEKQETRARLRRQLL